MCVAVFSRDEASIEGGSAAAEGDKCPAGGKGDYSTDYMIVHIRPQTDMFISYDDIELEMMRFSQSLYRMVYLITDL